MPSSWRVLKVLKLWELNIRRLPPSSQKTRWGDLQGDRKEKGSEDDSRESQEKVEEEICCSSPARIVFVFYFVF